MIGHVLGHKQFSKLVYISHHERNNMLFKYKLLISKRPPTALQYRSLGYFYAHHLPSFKILGSRGEDRVEIGKALGQREVMPELKFQVIEGIFQKKNSQS